MGLFSKIKQWVLYQPSEQKETFILPPYEEEEKSLCRSDKVSAKYDKNLAWMKSRFSIPQNNDIVLREFTLKNGVRAFLVHIDGMVRSVTVNEFILKPLLLGEFSDKNLQQQIADTIQINALKQQERMADAVEGIIAERVDAR